MWWPTRTALWQASRGGAVGTRGVGSALFDLIKYDGALFAVGPREPAAWALYDEIYAPEDYAETIEGEIVVTATPCTGWTEDACNYDYDYDGEGDPQGDCETGYCLWLFLSTWDINGVLWYVYQIATDACGECPCGTGSGVAHGGALIRFTTYQGDSVQTQCDT